MAQLSGVVTLRAGRTFQVIPRVEIRQAEVLDNATVKWWLLDGGDPYSWQFFDDEDDQAFFIAEQFYADITGATNEDVEWHRVSEDDEGESWTRNGAKVMGATA